MFNCHYIGITNFWYIWVVPVSPLKSYPFKNAAEFLVNLLWNIEQLGKECCNKLKKKLIIENATKQGEN